MKKLIVSCMLMMVIFSACYPIIYATEISTNEITEVQEEEKTQNLVTEEVVEESEEKPEEVTEEMQPEDTTETTQEEPETEPEQVEQPEPKEVEIIPNDEPQNVEAPLNYAGRMYLDSPTNGQTIMAANTNTLKIQGWAVSSDSQATLRLYVNGSYISNIHTRTSRGDVDSSVSPQYGGTANTPKAGFEFDLNIGNYAQGSYQIVVYQVARNETIISTDSKTIQIKPVQYAGRMYLDSPTNQQTIMSSDANTLKIQGWAVSNDSETTLRLYVNGNYISNIQKRTARGDVDSSVSPAYGGTANTPKAGFEYDLNIASYGQGTYQIVVYQIARNETILSTDTKTIQIKPTQYMGKMCVETGNNVSYSVPQTTKMNLSGWAVSNDALAYIVANIDGNDCLYDVARQARGDVDSSVSPAYGGTANTPCAGFSMAIDISNLADGRHTVKVSQVSRFGQILATTQINLHITTPMYAANMNLESPVHNKRYRSSSLEVSGWVMSEATDDYIRIYVNGTDKGLATRLERQDVINVFNGTYGGATYNPTPGFKAYIDTSKFGEGVYNLKVVHYSKYGKELESRQINFIISNTTTWGIDVSHHQGTINWNAVKSSGVNFAILKIGEYRESSKRILKDEHFEEYYRECKRLGIAVGGYFYSYAFNPTEAAHEADACSQLISGKSFEMPIFFDIEDKIVTNAINSGRTNRNEVTNAAITFCDVLNQRGYQAGVYSYRNFFYSYMNMAQLEKYNIWLAHYVKDTDYTGKYDMWQYTSSGTIPGITGAVDLNWCFKRYY